MIELSRVIRELRAELYEAAEAGKDEELRFEMGPVELEVTVAITNEASTGGKVRFWVAEADGSAKHGDVTTQRLKISLQPTLRSTGRAPEVSGGAGDRER